MRDLQTILSAHGGALFRIRPRSGILAAIAAFFASRKVARAYIRVLKPRSR